MPVETFPFDASEFLDDEASTAEYLSEALATNDATVIAHALGVVARARGMTQVARDAGMQREHLYRALSPRGRPELNTILQVIKALRLSLTMTSAETPSPAPNGRQGEYLTPEHPIGRPFFEPREAYIEGRMGKAQTREEAVVGGTVRVVGDGVRRKQASERMAADTEERAKQEADSE